MLKVATHCHSTYSDGEFTLSELREMFLKSGFDMVFMTDHAEWFDNSSISAYIDECKKLSDKDFTFVAGLEFECERKMHILGYGVTALADSTNPQDVITHIDKNQGISVIAHPGDSMFDWIESFDVLPFGIEVWNSKYDGPIAPRPRTFRLLNRLQARNAEMKAFYGTDLHWKNQYRGLFNELNCSATATDALKAFRTGNYHANHENQLTLPSSGVLENELAVKFEQLNSKYQQKQKLYKRLKKVGGSVGRNLPKPVKSRLRKLFS